MRIVSLSSGSKGNACVVEQDGVAILIDCGIGARTLKRRLERFVDQCLGEGLRPFTDYERVCSQFDRIYEAGGREVPDQKRRAGAAAVKALYIAAAVFAAVLLLKKTVYDPQALDRMNVKDREQILSEVARLEQDIDQLQAEQRELRDLVQ